MQHHASVDRRFGSATIWPNLKPKNDTFPSPCAPVVEPTKKMCKCCKFPSRDQLKYSIYRALGYIFFHFMSIIGNYKTPIIRAT